LFEATHFYENQHQWFVHVMVLMPDHVHFLVSFRLKDDEHGCELEAIYIKARQN